MRRLRSSALVPVAAPACLAALTACAGGAQPPADVVARFDDAEIPYSRFEAYLDESLGEPVNALSSDVLSMLFDQFLEEEMLVSMAQERDLAEVGSGRRRALAALLAETADEPDEAAVLAYYQEHREEFLRPERVRLAQILVDDRATAEAALTRIRQGVDFERVAREISQDPDEVIEGGTEIALEDLPKPFGDVIAKLEPDAVSDVVEAAQGFHIFHVLERLPARELPLSEVEGEIRDQLAQESSSRRLAELVTEAHNRYNPRVYERNLPFNYQGRYAETLPP